MALPTLDANLNKFSSLLYYWTPGPKIYETSEFMVLIFRVFQEVLCETIIMKTTKNYYEALYIL